MFLSEGRGLSRTNNAPRDKRLQRMRENSAILRLLSKVHA
jgi:hypothetical protein